MTLMGGDKAAVEVDVAVESFMWHCGIFNELGKDSKGNSSLQRSRTRSKLLKNTRAVAM